MTNRLLPLIGVLGLLSVSSFAVSANADFQCGTSKHTIIVDHPKDGQYRYRAWNKPKPISDPPDMEVKSGTVDVSGTGACRHSDYTFKRGNVAFLVSDDINCSETAAPANVHGYLSVAINGVEKANYWCVK
ncbi:hypothetical protein [Paraburkholderia aspalathi]|uniref:hypothetical protein n=1 Tax=Paraburkholderia aspalathi TaxID=1324617 RepID=UPI0038BA62CC